MKTSVLILTLDEERNLPACLDSVAWCDDVIVLDSHSADATRKIARERGARVIERTFDDYATHRTWAFESIEFEHPWVLSVDADERCTPELAEEIARLEFDRGGAPALYRLRRKDYLFDRWCRRSSSYPVWLGRLARPARVRFERRPVNAHPVVDGPVGYLRGHLLHYPFSKGMAQWLAKHNRYSSMEAEVCLHELDGGRIDWRGLLTRDPVRRRRALKELSFRMPARPWLKFLYMYLLRGGFLDGLPGLTYCTLQAVYEYMICLKLKELRRDEPT